MKAIVITGSTRGIGYGLAEAFLQQGCTVTVSGRKEESVDQAVEKLVQRFGRERVYGHACDVSEPAQLQALWDSSRQVFGKVDIWISNAGIANPLGKLWEQPEETMESVIQTNVLGAIYSAKTALNGMFAQGYGGLYTMLGFGSSGRQQDGLLLYGTSKAAVRYFSDGLAKEVEGTSVLVGALSPGMVVTDMMTGSRRTSPQTWERVKRVLNLLGDRVETIAPWFAKQILENQKNGVEIRWLTTGKLMWRVITSPFIKRKIIS